MSQNNTDPAPTEDSSTGISSTDGQPVSIEVNRDGEPDFIPVVYKAEWYHSASERNKIVEISSPSDLKPTEKLFNIREPVLEVITTIYVTERETEAATNVASRRLNAEPEQNHALVRDSLDGVEISEIGKTRVVVRSPRLLNTIRRSVDYYPHQDFTGDSITIVEPYMCLIHYYDVLQKFALPCEGGASDLPCKLHSHISTCNKETKEHIQILLDFLAPTMENKIAPALKKLNRENPVITFDMAWLLFQPGTEIYEDFTQPTPSGFRMATVVYEAEYKKATDDMDKEERECLVLYSWFMCSNGEDIGRSVSKSWIICFEGEKEVNRLPVYPCSYEDPDLRTSFISRGKVAYNLFKDRNKAIFFDGSAYSNKKRVRYRGRAIIDPVSTAKYNIMEDLIYWHPGPMVMPDRSPHLIEIGGKANKYSDYDGLNTTSELTDKQYFLMLPFIGGFGLDDKEWKVFHAEGVQSASYDKTALEKLVLDPNDLNIIKAISYRKSLAQRPPTLDFIEGKGRGQVILLHGPPGVGKTFTVESIAAYFGRPLLSLSIADIGAQKSAMETVLTRWFNLAETWNAILLIDEADVFLEMRGKNNLERNGLVSVFLRTMEYFQGLLFLTTNRIGQIDDAFSSRVHAKIQYPKLDNSKRSKIWDAFFEKLKSGSGNGIYVAKTARQYVLENPDITARNWNGREIRNAFQTAIALAEYEASEDDGRPPGQAVEVKKEHFAQVMEMSRKFTEYIDHIDGRDEDERAKSRKDRRDPS